MAMGKRGLPAQQLHSGQEVADLTLEQMSAFGLGGQFITEAGMGDRDRPRTIHRAAICQPR